MGEVTVPATDTGSPEGILQALLDELPDPAELAEEQVCGRACVCCASALDNTTAIDLGARAVDAHGSRVRWYPRICRSCGYTRIFEVWQEHVKGCKQCSTSLPWCREGQQLFGAAMKANRAPRR